MALYVTGTSANDHILVQRKGNSGQIEVKLNNQTFTFAESSFDHIIVHGLAGNDHIQVQDKITKEAWLFGDDDNDHIQAGSGHSVLIGGKGDDHLQGGKGRDLLIGGEGKDHLQGQGDDDIMIAGFTNHDSSDAALCAIMDEWTSTNTYPNRVANLAGLLNPLTVHDDGVEDMLVSGSGRDWFFANIDGNGSVNDKISGRKPNEVIDDID